MDNYFIYLYLYIYIYIYIYKSYVMKISYENFIFYLIWQFFSMIKTNPEG